MAKRKTLPVEEVYSRTVMHEPKVLVYRMIAQKTWVWIKPHRLAKRLPLRQFSQSVRIPSPAPPRYIPVTLPPAEVPQVHFKPPSSLAQWRDSHQEWLEALW
jgi:hypothetical protein